MAVVVYGIIVERFLMCASLQDSDGEKSDTDLVVDDVNNQMSPHNGDRRSRSASPPLHSGARKTPGSGGSSAGAASSSAGGGGIDKLPKRDPDQSSRDRERDTSSRASSGSASGKHRDVSIGQFHWCSRDNFCLNRKARQS